MFRSSFVVFIIWRISLFLSSHS